MSNQSLQYSHKLKLIIKRYKHVSSGYTMSAMWLLVDSLYAEQETLRKIAKDDNCEAI